MGTNAFLKKQQEKQQMCFEAGCQITAQQFFDYLCLVLNDPDVMGKDVFGANRLHKIHEEMKKLDKIFSEAFVGGQESDYYQEKMDARLIKIFGKIDPFKVRYPFLKDWNYNKPLRK